jgi:hypothetical protein
VLLLEVLALDRRLALSLFDKARDRGRFALEVPNDRWDLGRQLTRL